MLHSFEPAFAGGLLSRNAALALAYRVISVETRALFGGVGSKRERNITYMAGLDFLYHIQECNGREKLKIDYQQFTKLKECPMLPEATPGLCQPCHDLPVMDTHA